jgi:hypothetical protein
MARVKFLVGCMGIFPITFRMAVGPSERTKGSGDKYDISVGC